MFRQKQVDDHHMYLISPKAGVEIPISPSNNFVVEGATYFFGPDHRDEYNSESFFFGVKHRF